MFFWNFLRFLSEFVCFLSVLFVFRFSFFFFISLSLFFQFTFLQMFICTFLLPYHCNQINKPIPWTASWFTFNLYSFHSRRFRLFNHSSIYLYYFFRLTWSSDISTPLLHRSSLYHTQHTWKNGTIKALVYQIVIDLIII